MARNLRCRWSGDGSHVEVLDGPGPGHWVRVRNDSQGHLTCTCRLFGVLPGECPHLRHAAEFLESVPCRYQAGQAFAALTVDDPYRIAARERLPASQKGEDHDHQD